MESGPGEPQFHRAPDIFSSAGDYGSLYVHLNALLVEKNVANGNARTAWQWQARRLDRPLAWIALTPYHWHEKACRDDK